MSVIPYLFGCDPWECRSHPLQRYWGDWDKFGLGISPNEIRSLLELPRRMLSSPRFLGTGSEFPLSGGVIGKDGFQASINVQQFKPNEITVKTVDNTVIVEGKHEERPDEHGYISRQFVRKYVLPKEYDPEQVVSSLSSDGILTIIAAPPKDAIEGGKERIVQIQQTGPAHLNVKENPKEEEPPK